jgi:Tfp pilus assembly protein PilO
MSDVMLHSVLNMPPELWSGSPIDVMQRHSRYLQASKYICELTEQRDRLAELLSDMQDYTKGVKRYDYSKLTLYKRMQALHDDWQEIECKIEQLLQQTPTQTEPK